MPRQQGNGSRWAVAWLVLALVAGQVRAADDAAVVEARMRRDVTFLASAECEGRGVGTKGIDLAADYIAAEFRKAGLKPADADGSFFQPFSLSGTPKLGSPNTLVLTGPLSQQVTLASGSQFQPLGFSKTTSLPSLPLVFAGYGITAPDAHYDDYQGLDVAGKLAIVLRKTPRPERPTAPFARGDFAALRTKMFNAAEHRAAGVIFVNDAATAAEADSLMTFSYSARAMDEGEIPAVHLRRNIVDAMMQASLGVTLASVEQDIDRTLKPASAPLAGWSAAITANIVHHRIPAKNIVGVLEGEGPRAQETVVIGAHYDHLGYGEFGSLAKFTKPTIHPGADDNGSGTSALMELARRFARQAHRERRLVFIAFSGEERGLLGSAYYCRNPLFPLKDTVAMVNLDMVGRLSPDKESDEDKLQIHGTGTSPGFVALVDELNNGYHFKLQKVASGFGPSDHASFYAKKIPVLFFFTGDHADYHRPSDTAEKINVAGMCKVTDMVEQTVTRLEALPNRPEYVAVRGSAIIRMQSPIPRLGIRPSYGDDGDGVLLDGVVEGGPAARAGLKDGDRIVEIAGKHVKNLEAYMSLMGQHKPGQEIELAIVRNGQKIAAKVKPE